MPDGPGVAKNWRGWLDFSDPEATEQRTGRRGEEGMNRERRTQIIGIRVPPAAKKRILEEAQKREETLTDFLFELIGAGWNIVVKQNRNEFVKQ
jgi:hypothetical protein